jgi:hypothetical protein
MIVAIGGPIRVASGIVAESLGAGGASGCVVALSLALRLTATGARALVESVEGAFGVDSTAADGNKARI